MQPDAAHPHLEGPEEDDEVGPVQQVPAVTDVLEQARLRELDQLEQAEPAGHREREGEVELHAHDLLDVGDVP